MPVYEIVNVYQFTESVYVRADSPDEALEKHDLGHILETIRQDTAWVDGDIHEMPEFQAQDSGSMIFDVENGKVTPKAMAFAGSRFMAIATPIKKVMDALGIRPYLKNKERRE